MVAWSTHQNIGITSVTLQPNRSLDWIQAKRLILAFAIILGGIALCFAQQGAWLVLPFTGVETVLLAGCIYLCNRSTYREEAIQLSRGRIRIEQSAGIVEFDPNWLRIRLIPSPRGERPSRLVIGTKGRYIPIGEFLTEPERRQLATDLEQQLQRNARVGMGRKTINNEGLEAPAHYAKRGEETACA